jgi:hypothetical protein
MGLEITSGYKRSIVVGAAYGVDTGFARAEQMIKRGNRKVQQTGDRS